MKEKKRDFRRIGIVFLVLVVLTILEIIVAVNAISDVLLIIIALAKAGLVINYFMHISRLWKAEDH